jgi:hypothetical protein
VAATVALVTKWLLPQGGCCHHALRVMLSAPPYIPATYSGMADTMAFSDRRTEPSITNPMAEFLIALQRGMMPYGC